MLAGDPTRPSGLRAVFEQRTRSAAVFNGGELNTRIAVTGGSGFMGTNLIDFYLAHGARNIVNWDVRSPKNVEHAPYWRPLDLCNSSVVTDEVMSFEPDVVFHLAARTDLLGRDVTDYSANVEGVRNLISAVSSSPRPADVIFASSRLVCQIGYEPTSETDYCPPNAYGESKVLGEKIVRELEGSTLNWIIVRPTSVWGPWFGTPYRDFFEAVAHGRYVNPSGALIYKSFSFVGNASFQLDRLMFGAFDRLNHKTIYLADYPPLGLQMWANEVARCLGRKEVPCVPAALLKVLAKLGDAATRLGRTSVPLNTFRLNNLMTNMVHDTAPLEAVVGRLPFSLSEGTALTVNWMAECS